MTKIMTKKYDKNIGGHLLRAVSGYLVFTPSSDKTFPNKQNSWFRNRQLVSNLHLYPLGFSLLDQSQFKDFEKDKIYANNWPIFIYSNFKYR